MATATSCCPCPGPERLRRRPDAADETVRLCPGHAPHRGGMTTDAARPNVVPLRTMLNKVPEVTLYFWVIKILCTTVGETFADYLNETLGFGLDNTSLLMTGAAGRRAGLPVPGPPLRARRLLALGGADQRRRHPAQRQARRRPRRAAWSPRRSCSRRCSRSPSRPGTPRERTLSIHSIVTRRREAFYWLAILFTFALGTSAGDLFDEQLRGRLLADGRTGRGGHRPGHRRAPVAGAQRRAGVLGRLHPDPSARRVDRRRHVPGPRRRRPGTGHDGHQRDLPGR